jgi:predicted RecA/RadA family phage recombinase
MASFLAEDDIVDLLNNTSNTIANGTIVAAPDNRAAIVEGLAGIKPGRRGKGRVRGVVLCDKAPATVIAAGDRLQIATATQLVTVKTSGAADSGNILLGRARAAAGNGTVTVEVVLNGTGVI